MGYIVLPNGYNQYVNELEGSVNLTELVKDMMEPDYTDSYRVAVIGVISKLGKHATSAINELKNVVSTDLRSLVRKAAESAISKISNSKLADDSSVWNNANNKNRVFDNHGTRHSNTGTSAPSINRPRSVEVTKITINPVSDGIDDLAEGSKSYCRCNFCEKLSIVTPYLTQFINKLSNGVFYCPYCLRNDQWNRCNRNIMVLTFRGIIGYYYYAYHVAPKTAAISINELAEHIDLHIRVGLQNPLFRYDPDTYCWFVDFGKVGNKGRRMDVSAVTDTIMEILASFQLYENVRDCSPRKLYQKYVEAVTMFHAKRERKNGEKVFAPSLFGCDIPNHCPAGLRAIPVDLLQGFLPYHMQEISYQNRDKRRLW